MIRRTMRPFVVPVLLGACTLVRAGEKVLYEKDSAFNHIVVKEDDQGLRHLLFEKDGALQSVVKVGDPDYLHLPYVRAMLVGLAYVEEPKRILVVGLGGGTIPSFLHKHYPKVVIHVVDIDPDVVEVAKRFFGFREDDSLRAYVADGRLFIEDSKDRYDIVFLDAFASDNIPYHLATREFLQAVQRILSPKGVVVGNIWSRYSNPLYDSMVRTYQDAFEELTVFDVSGSGNKILVARPRKGKIGKEELTRRAREISKEGDFPFDLSEAVTYGYRYAADARPDAPVLTDPEEEPEKKGERSPRTR